MKCRPGLSSKICGHSSPPAKKWSLSPPSASRTEKSPGITSVHLTSKCSLLQHASRSMPFSRYFKTFHGWMLGDTSSFEMNANTLDWIYQISSGMCAFVTSSSYSSVVCNCNFWMSAMKLWLTALVTGSGHGPIWQFCICL